MKLRFGKSKTYPSRWMNAGSEIYGFSEVPSILQFNNDVKIIVERLRTWLETGK